MASHQFMSGLDSDMEEDKGLLTETITRPPRPLYLWSRAFLGRTAERHYSLVLSHLITGLCFYLPIISFIALRSPTFEACDRKISTWSPALEAVRYKDPDFFHGIINQTNRFRGELGKRPTSEIDNAWKSIGVGTPGFRLTAEEVKRLGKPIRNGTKILHQVPDEKGGYIAQLEVNHLLHCLNNIRQAMAWNYDFYFTDIPVWQVQIHHEHCIDALRISLMCSADITPLLYYDDEAAPARVLSLPDFSTKHTCRNFDALMNWTWSTERVVMWEDVGNSTTYNPSSKEG